MVQIRDANLPQDLDVVERLWLEYLTWGNDELVSRHGLQFPVREAIARDLEDIGKFQPPDGRLLLAFDDDRAVGTACMKRIGPDTVEIKRMYVQPSHRRAGVGRALLDKLITAARAQQYVRVRLDSPDFMTASHELYRSNGFVPIGPYPESEVPDHYQAHWVFMERMLT